MRVPGLARKFCTMISWMWPCRRWMARSASSASMRSVRVSPMPIRMPVVNGIRARTAALTQAIRQRLQHEPLRGGYAAQQSQLVLTQDTGVEMRQEAGLVEHRLRHRVQIRHGAVMAERRQRLARRAIARSGRSPSVNSASSQPAAAPARAIASTSSRVR
jgi:hypothetical protein